MSEGQKDRKMWKKWAVDAIYEMQEGVCSNCGAGLEQTGFHQHHKNEDHSDNSLENLVLLCPRCHHATFGGDKNPYTAQQEQEGRILEKLNILIEQALDPNTKVSGASMEKLVDAMGLSLKVSRSVTDVDYGRQYTPAAVKLQRKMADQEAQAESYMAGYMDAVKQLIGRFAGETLTKE